MPSNEEVRAMVKAVDAHKKPIRVVVEVERGMVEEIYTSTPNIEMFVIDKDILDGRIDRWTRAEVQTDAELDQMIADYLADSLDEVE